jgi:hypothetical protein
MPVSTAASRSLPAATTRVAQDLFPRRRGIVIVMLKRLRSPE